MKMNILVCLISCYLMFSICHDKWILLPWIWSFDSLINYVIAESYVIILLHTLFEGMTTLGICFSKIIMGFSSFCNAYLLKDWGKGLSVCHSLIQWYIALRMHLLFSLKCIVFISFVYNLKLGHKVKFLDIQIASRDHQLFRFISIFIQ